MKLYGPAPNRKMPAHKETRPHLSTSTNLTVSNVPNYQYFHLQLIATPMQSRARLSQCAAIFLLFCLPIEVFTVFLVFYYFGKTLFLELIWLSRPHDAGSSSFEQIRRCPAHRSVSLKSFRLCSPVCIVWNCLVDAGNVFHICPTKQSRALPKHCCCLFHGMSFAGFFMDQHTT
jgi:hypothetical protein